MSLTTRPQLRNYSCVAKEDWRSSFTLRTFQTFFTFDSLLSIWTCAQTLS